MAKGLAQNQSAKRFPNQKKKSKPMNTLFVLNNTKIGFLKKANIYLKFYHPKSQGYLKSKTL